MGHLTLEEQALLDSFDRGEWVSHSNLTDRNQQLQGYAHLTLQLEIVLPQEYFHACDFNRDNS